MKAAGEKGQAREKRYVAVVTRTERDGSVVPLRIEWRDGTSYVVEAILDERRAYSQRTGGSGVRYTVRVRGHVTHLFYENPRWFVEAKAVPMP